MTKGQLEGLASLIIFGAILAVLIMGFFYPYGNVFQQKTPVDICKYSVLTQSALKFGGGYEVFKTNIKCPAQELKVTGDLSSESGQQHAKQQIGDALVECYDKFGQGDVTLFDGPGIYCGVCHWVTFEDTGKQLEGLNTFLATTKVPSKSVNYLEFLAKRQFGKELVDVPPPTSLALNSDQLYSTVFVYSRGDSATNKLKEYLATPQKSLVVGTIVTGTTAFVILGWAPTAVLTFVGGRFLLTSLAGIAGGLAGAYESIIRDKPDHTAFIALVPHESKSFEQLGCEKYVSTK